MQGRVGSATGSLCPSARLTICPVLAPTPQRKPWRRLPPARPSTAVQGIGQDATQGWLDLASFVSASGGTKTPYEELADAIGRDVYLDVQGWHLYLKDVRLGGSANLAQGLAQQLGAQIDGGGFKEADLAALLKKVPIKLGQGKVTVSLADVLPSACVRDLERICEDYGRRR